MRRRFPSSYARIFPARFCTTQGSRGFTLIELLVAVTVLLILATMTFTMVNVSLKGDPIRTGARQIQSYMEGARDRAIHARDLRGVRFLRDPNNTNVVNAMVFIQAMAPDSSTTLKIHQTDKRTISIPSSWNTLDANSLLARDGMLITLRNVGATSDPVPYTAYYNTTASAWQLTKDYADATYLTALSANAPYGANLECVAYPGAVVLPNQEPRLLPAGILIDLSYSQTPWTSSTTNLDCMFSPRGMVSGLLGSAGNIHLMLRDIRDVERNLTPLDSACVGEKLIVSLTTQTGKVTSHPVNFDATDLFRYAETGEEAK